MELKNDVNKIAVYMFHNPETNKAYVGSAKNVYVRKSAHESMLRSNTHPNYRFQAAFNKNSNFEFVPLFVENREEAYDFEQSVIDEFIDNKDLLNISRDAKYGAYEITPETRMKMSLNAKERKYSDETRRRMSASRIGKPVNNGLAELSRNRVYTAEDRALISQRMIGNKNGIGHTQTEEHKQILFQANSISVRVGDRIFESAAAAAKFFNVSVSTITNRIRSSNFSDWEYANEESANRAKHKSDLISK